MRWHSAIGIPPRKRRPFDFGLRNPGSCRNPKKPRATSFRMNFCSEKVYWVYWLLIISKAGLHFAWSFVCIDKLIKLIMGLPSDPVTVFDVRPAWRCLRIGSTVAPLHLRGFTVLRALQSPGWSHLWKVPCFGQPQLASAYNTVAKNWWRYRLQHLDVKMLDVGHGCQLRMANLRAEMILQSVRNLGYFELGNSAKKLDSWRALALPNVSPSGIIRYWSQSLAKLLRF